MKFEIRFLDSIKHPIDGFVDALIDEPETKEYHISVSFLDRRKNSAVILATGEFGEYMKTKFKTKDLIFTLPENYHNPFHNSYLNDEGYKICGCGWKESEQEHTKRMLVVRPVLTTDIDGELVKGREEPVVIESLSQMKIISRSDIPK